MEIGNVINQDIQMNSIANTSEIKEKTEKTNEKNANPNIENAKPVKEGADSMLDKKQPVFKKDYNAVSKDGDTLEITNNKENNNPNNNKITILEDGISKSTTKMSDAALQKCSKVKLIQLLHDGQISKLQYDKAIKAKQ